MRIRRSTSGTLLGIVLGFALLAAACGDSGGGEAGPDPSQEAATATTTTAVADTAPAAPDLPPECVLPPSTVEIRRSGDGPREVMSVVDATSIRKLGGRAFTVYLTDFAIDREARLFGQVSEPAPGAITVQTGIDVFNAEDAGALPILEAGVSGAIEWTAGEPATFLSIVTGGEEQGGFSVDQAGATELLYVDDNYVCMRSDITTESGTELVGTYVAEVLEDF